MYVTELDITAFRGIKECQEPLRLDKFNVLLGRNNSGKSAVLHALSLLPSPDLPPPKGLPFPTRGGSPWRVLFLESLTGGGLVYRYAGEALITVSFSDGKKLELRLWREGDWWRAALSDPVYRSALTGWQSVAAHLGMGAIDDQVAATRCLLIPSDSRFIGAVLQLLSQKWEEAEKEDIHVKAVRELVNPAVDERFTEVVKRDASLWARKEVGEGRPYYVRLEDLGDGIEKALAAFAFVELCSPELVLWDDFEGSAHPSLIRLMLRWLASRDWQIVLATHSIDVLRELVEVRPEGCQVVQLNKRDDVLAHRTLTLDELDDIMTAGTDPRLLVDAVPHAG